MLVGPLQSNYRVVQQNKPIKQMSGVCKCPILYILFSGHLPFFLIKFSNNIYVLAWKLLHDNAVPIAYWLYFDLPYCNFMNVNFSLFRSVLLKLQSQACVLSFSVARLRQSRRQILLLRRSDVVHAIQSFRKLK